MELKHPDPKTDREAPSTITITVTPDDDGAPAAAGRRAGRQRRQPSREGPDVHDRGKDAATKVKVTDDAGADDRAAVRAEYKELTVAPGPKYAAHVINADPMRLVDVMDVGATLPDKDRVLDVAALDASAGNDLVAPEPPDLDAVPAEGPDDLKGEEVHRTGLGGLAGIDEITMVCVPDLMAMQPTDLQIRDVHAKVNEFCSNGQIKRMAILDPPPGLTKMDIAAWRADPATPSSNFAVLYWPWIEVMDPFSDKPMLVPPCGHMAGVWAGTDSDRGVHKAPANVAVQAAIGVATDITDGDQDALNPEGINCIRGVPRPRHPGLGCAHALRRSRVALHQRAAAVQLRLGVDPQGHAVGGVRAQRRVPVGQLRVSVGNFLLGVWRGGALFGSSPDQAFFVKCDAETNPQDLIDSGQVNIHIGIAPVKPAEFVIFQIASTRRRHERADATEPQPRRGPEPWPATCNGRSATSSSSSRSEAPRRLRGSPKRAGSRPRTR